MITGLININSTLVTMQAELQEYSDKVKQEKVNNLFRSYYEYYENIEPASDLVLYLDVEGKYISGNDELMRLSTLITSYGKNILVQTTIQE